MRELSLFDQKEVRRLVARYIFHQAGFLREAEELNRPRIDRELWEHAYDMADELKKECIR